MIYRRLHKILWLSLLGGSLATALVGYSLGLSCLQDWLALTSDELGAPLLWSKALMLAGWLSSALSFLRDRNHLLRDL
ncbi:hypothetical protein [Fibrella forsythiae]|uniref:Chloride channel protein n=1 Tax=Fibrella forsythiae TaxID=2817061 RepID=A0ABS3JFV3_9BACT|nr:hypothetical protein [Fibrella forsythiae]MBO0948164.1 hypothetical protein [Fibrella forsythiae]